MIMPFWLAKQLACPLLSLLTDVSIDFNDMKVYEIQEWIEKVVEKYGSDIDVSIDGHDFTIAEIPESVDESGAFVPAEYKLTIIK